MHSRIIVIHSSEIIRLGLSEILKKLFDVDVILISSIEDLNNYNEFINFRLVFIIESNHFNKTLNSFRENNSVKVVSLYKNKTEANSNENYDCRMPIHASSEQIQKLLKPYLHQDQSTISKKGSSSLTEREIDVVKLVALGKINKEIADELCISIHTVISHRKNITEKLGIKSISGLTVYAILNKLIDTSTMDLESLI
jgi:DNA-binding CsgD family transcriptional regulator